MLIDHAGAFGGHCLDPALDSLNEFVGMTTAPGAQEAPRAKRSLELLRLGEHAALAVVSEISRQSNPIALAGQRPLH